MCEELINSLTIALADSCSLSVKDLRNLLCSEMRNYSITKMETTLPSVGDGSVTKFVLEEFVKNKINLGVKQNSLKLYSYTFTAFFKFVNKEITMVDYRDINDYLLHLKKNEAKPSTIINQRRHLGNLFNFAFSKGFITVNPVVKADKVNKKKIEKIPITKAEEEKIKLCCEKSDDQFKYRTLAIIYLLMDTGMRINELADVNISDVNFNEKEIVIRHGKGDKRRTVFFKENTLVRLQDYLSLYRPQIKDGYTDDTPLFTTRGGNRMQVRNYQRIIKRLGVQAGVPRLHPHLFRTTFATRLYEKDIPINTIAELMGHSSVNTTINNYIIVNKKKLKTTYDKVS